MANLNLSEFTEKLFVADADHTFIWDTAASISKRVSRNSWLSGTTADFHLGLADAASPVAQTISVQSVVAGTSNTAGANFSINGSQGTGTGAGGALLLRTAPAGSSGTAQNALVTAVAITAAGNVGIGTTSPTSKLHVALNPAANYTTETVRFGNIHFGNGTSNYTFMWMGSISVPLTLSDSNFILASDGSGTILSSPSTTGLVFRVAGSNKAIIDNNGSLGVGTLSPVATSKIQASGGDIEVDTSANGLVLKSPDGTRYRIKVPNGGASLTITAL